MKGRFMNAILIALIMISGAQFANAETSNTYKCIASYDYSGPSEGDRKQEAQMLQSEIFYLGLDKPSSVVFKARPDIAFHADLVIGEVAYNWIKDRVNSFKLVAPKQAALITVSPDDNSGVDPDLIARSKASNGQNYISGEFHFFLVFFLFKF